MASVRIAHMSRDEVMDRLVQLGWEPTANVTYTLLEKKSILHELEEKMTKSEMNDNTNVCAGLSQKNKTELRDVCKVLSIPLSGRETKPQLTRKIKEAQAEREPLRQAILDFGRHRGKTYEWVCAHDKQYCEWAVMTNVEEGATASPQLRKFATYVEQSLGTSPRVTSSPRRKVHSQTTKLEPGRIDETSGTATSDSPTTEDDSEVQCSLKKIDDQQRAMLRKSAKQLFMDEIDQLTTNEAGHTDLAEIGSMGQSELLSTCELLGGRTLQISRDTGCDLLTREGRSRAVDLLRDHCPTVCWFRISCALWCPWRWGVTVTSTTEQIRSCTEDED